MNEFSVVIAAYNAEATIVGSVKSALVAGAHKIFVVDDGSSDATGTLAAEAGASVISQENAGAAAARRRGAQAVDTPYLTFLDADDELVADGVQESLAIISSHDDVSVVGGRVVAIARDGTESLLKKTYETVTTEALLTTGFGAWPPGAAIVRTESWNSLSDLEPPALNPRFAEDYESLIRLSMVGRVLRHDKVSLKYRIYGGKSVRSARQAILCKEQLRMHYSNFLGLRVDLMSKQHINASASMRLSRAARGDGRPIRAAWCYTQAILHRAASVVAPRRIG